jgi:hypothetical protein
MFFAVGLSLQLFLSPLFVVLARLYPPDNST